jgi:hypothetical protein
MALRAARLAPILETSNGSLPENCLVSDACWIPLDGSHTHGFPARHERMRIPENIGSVSNALSSQSGARERRQALARLSC